MRDKSGRDKEINWERERQRLKHLAEWKRRHNRNGEVRWSMGRETNRPNKRDKAGDVKIKVEERKRYICVPDKSGDKKDKKRPQPWK